MKYNRWTGGTYDMSAVARLREAGYPSLLATVLAARGITDEEAEALFAPTRCPLHDAMLMRDMDKAVSRVEQALANKEKIVVFGDYDVDGITATVL